MGQVLEQSVSRVTAATRRGFTASSPVSALESPVAALGKRVFDLVVALAALAVVGPLLLIGIALVLIDSGAPVFYSAERRGLNGRSIRVLKLRTMRLGADREGRGISASGDPRITRIGQVLRRWKLDELPQLWNVLRGDMSVVGPRPQSPDVAESPDKEPLIYSVRPGLTDWSSILFNDEAQLLSSADDVAAVYQTRIRPLKRFLAREYARRASPIVDGLIMLQTAWVLFASRVLHQAVDTHPWNAAFARLYVDTTLGPLQQDRRATR